jgi:hypothetical protein
VLTRAGGWFDGVMALVTVVVIGNQVCWDWIVTLNVCWWVPGTTTNVHVAGPLVGLCPSR